MVTIRNKATGTEVGTHIECAEDSFSRLFGLLGREGLEPGEGLWIRPSSGVHTMGMRFSIDVVGLDKHMRVVRLWTNLKPFRATSLSLAVQSVIELAAGEIEARSIHLGDGMEAQPHDFSSTPKKAVRLLCNARLKAT